MAIRLFAATALAVLLCASAEGAEPTFSYLDMGMIKAGHGGSGAGVRGAAGLGEHAVASIGLDAYDYFNGSVGTLSVGGGTRWSVMPTLQAMAGLSAEIFGGSYDDHDDGGIDGLVMGVGAGGLLRGRANERVELEAGLRYVQVVSESASGKLMATGALRLFVTPRLALGLDLGNDYFGLRGGLSLRLDLRRR